MASTRLTSKSMGVNENLNPLVNHGVTTRSKQFAAVKNHKGSLKATNKRKADSPLKDVIAKRAAFGDITNAFNKSSALNDKDKIPALKKVKVEKKLLPTVKSIKPPTVVNGKSSKAKTLQKVATNAIETVQKHFAKDPPKPVATRVQSSILKHIERKSLGKDNQNHSQSSLNSAKNDSGEPSLYVTAFENVSPSDLTKEECKVISEKLNKVNLDDSFNRSLDKELETPHKVPEGVVDFDLENLNDPNQVSNYAMDIFNYMRSREKFFVIDDYLQRMRGITAWMRSLLVDWMVEVQESFELNHETLYLAVKLVDLFLSKSTKTRPQKDHLPKEELQLLGASALVIASKFEERFPLHPGDVLYIGDGAYTQRQLVKMEINILQVVEYNLCIPLSYRFLRRYARCARVSMPTLTLARFVLELCLLEYGMLGHSDSKMAAAALYIALRMKSLGSWTDTLVYYTGYSLDSIMPVVLAQNAVLHKKPKAAVSTVRNKYTHKIFFEVAKVPLIEDAALKS